ncbi:hypothetical protein [Streptomyces hundungensis]|uniref:hypothetical protein n=1 Tax=Streptomyces hundungensis TaxID=1077946 RepID=UPI003404983A
MVLSTLSVSGLGICGFGWTARLLCELLGFGCDIGVDLCRCSVAVFEDVVLVVQCGQSLGQGQLVPEALVDLPARGASARRPASVRQVPVRRLPFRSRCPLGRR